MQYKASGEIHQELFLLFVFAIFREGRIFEDLSLNYAALAGFR